MEVLASVVADLDLSEIDGRDKSEERREWGEVFLSCAPYVFVALIDPELHGI
jgi:hypothetical protein